MTEQQLVLLKRIISVSRRNAAKRKDELREFFFFYNIVGAKQIEIFKHYERLKNRFNFTGNAQLKIVKKERKVKVIKRETRNRKNTKEKE